MPHTDYSQLSQDYEKIGQAIQFLESHRLEQPGLTELANDLHMSEYHLQRLFSRWVGVSPKRFMQHLTKENANDIRAKIIVEDIMYTNNNMMFITTHFCILIIRNFYLQ